MSQFFEFGDWDEEDNGGDDLLTDSCIRLETGPMAVPTFELADLVKQSIHYKAIHAELEFTILQGPNRVEASLEKRLGIEASALINSLDYLPDMNALYSKLLAVETAIPGLHRMVLLFLKPRHFDVNTRILHWYMVATSYQLAEEVFNTDDHTDRNRLIADAIPDMPEAIRNVWLQTY